MIEETRVVALWAAGTAFTSWRLTSPANSPPSCTQKLHCTGYLLLELGADVSSGWNAKWQRGFSG